jgi:hypothetical protein
MSTRADLERLEHELAGCLRDVALLARSAGSGTAAEWAALVEAMCGPQRPLPRTGDAANPAEVRAVLLGVRTRFELRLRVLERAGDRDDDAFDDALWTFRHRRLEFVEPELAAYIKLVAPRPSVAAAFGRAASAASAPVRPAPANVQLHRCKTCGAPRRADGVYGDCRYCGNPLFKEID